MATPGPRLDNAIGAIRETTPGAFPGYQTEVQQRQQPSDPDFIGPTPADALAGAQQQAALADATVEQGFQQDLARLRSAYRTSPTAREKAALAAKLGDIERRKNEGKRAVQAAFSDAVKDVRGMAGQQRRFARQEGRAVRNLYQGTQRETGNILQKLNEMFAGTSGGSSGGLSSATEGQIGALGDAAAREGEFARQTNMIGAQGLAQQAGSLRGQQAARGGEMERLAAQLASGAQQEHLQSVNDRISQERMALAQAIAQMQDRRRQQQFQTGQRHQEMQFEAQQNALDRRLRAQAEGIGEGEEERFDLSFMNDPSFQSRARELSQDGMLSNADKLQLAAQFGLSSQQLDYLSQVEGVGELFPEAEGAEEPGGAMGGLGALRAALEASRASGFSLDPSTALGSAADFLFGS